MKRPFARPSLTTAAAAAAASVPLPPSSAALAAGCSVSCRDLPPPSPQGALPGTGRGGGRSLPPSLPRTLSEARRIVGELRRGATLSDRRKRGKRPEWHAQSSHFHTLPSPFAHPVKRRKKKAGFYITSISLLSCLHSSSSPDCGHFVCKQGPES